MTPRIIIAFQHDSKLGNAPAHELQERLCARLKNPDVSARCYSDYEITFDESNLPEGVKVIRILG